MSGKREEERERRTRERKETRNSPLFKKKIFRKKTKKKKKQRYHYNVANSRVEQHVDKGNDDGLYISSVACCQELWALIMDAVRREERERDCFY